MSIFFFQKYVQIGFKLPGNNSGLYQHDGCHKNHKHTIFFLKDRHLLSSTCQVHFSLFSYLQYDPEISIRFKSLVEKHASQFKGNNQHDAQEFLLWLLDRVHEDLNLATKRRYKPYGGRNNNNNNNETFSDEAMAAEALANYIRHNRRWERSF